MPASAGSRRHAGARYPHEHIRDDTAKLLTLFHPRTGEVRVHGVPSCTNVVLHGWLESQLEAILLDTLPPPVVLPSEANWARWRRWQEGLVWPLTYPALAALPHFVWIMRRGVRVGATGRSWHGRTSPA